jgi:1-acyl-sn-glycerol-3-phosphate acyltransferase
MRNVRSIPLKRGSDFNAVRKSISILKGGNPLVIFPEGTRTPDGELKEGERGAGFLVSKAGVPVVPVYVGGAREALPKLAKRPKFFPIKVYFGVPVGFGPLLESHTKESYDRISQMIMERIGELKARYESEAR